MYQLLQKNVVFVRQYIRIPTYLYVTVRFEGAIHTWADLNKNQLYLVFTNKTKIFFLNQLPGSNVDFFHR